MKKKLLKKNSLNTTKTSINPLWGEQTKLALRHFDIGSEMMPKEIIYALALIKKSAALANQKLGVLAKNKAQLIVATTEAIMDNQLDEHFPLKIWQSGSGTQTNMNINEVIANYAMQLAKKSKQNFIIHPNDDVNMSQSTNDVFPSAMHIAALKLLNTKLFPAIKELRIQLHKKQQEFKDILKIGRTHLQDAVPLTLGQEFSGYVAQLDFEMQNLQHGSEYLKELPLGGTAVGTGLNAHPDFGKLAIQYLFKFTKINFVPAKNKFSQLAAHDTIAATSSALKNLAGALYKIANDIRWLASGPDCGIGELILPSNEPGSSIMPGKVNPTQCEALMMICAQVMGNDAGISFANSQSNLELNVFKPVIIYNLLQAMHLLADGCQSFSKYAITELRANREKIAKYLNSSLMLATVLAPEIGYDKVAKIVKYAKENKITLRIATAKLGYLNTKEFDKLISKTVK